MHELQKLYQDIILDHNRNPRNFGKLDAPTHQECGYNPICGDEVKLYLRIDSRQVIRGVSFEGQGCAISRASASLLTEYIEGMSRAALKEETTKIIDALELSDSTFLADNKLKALSGVKKFPARLKCVLLPWETLQKLL